MDDSLSISISVDKLGPAEEMSISRACLDDARKQLIDEAEQKAITNERIRKNDNILGIYKVTSDEFRGGKGSVWRLHHSEWDIDLAIKQPLPQYFAEAGYEKKAAFVEECENWINLGTHPYVVSCYYVREIGGIPTIFSEWMENGSLADRIADGELYKGGETEVQKRVLRIAIQSAGGLFYTHKKGLMHQDVKPGNILLSSEWEAKVADFGFAKAASRLTSVSGYTPAYCPKEQISGAEPAPWMDLYSWGLAVIEMYAGQRIWDNGPEAYGEIFEKADRQEVRWRVKPPQKLLEMLRKCFSDASDTETGHSCTEKDFGGMIAVLEEISAELEGEAYYMEDPDDVSSTSDSLNNLALSYLDLGMQDIAAKYWGEALTINPVHFESIINEGIFRWRKADITDQDMIDRIISAEDVSYKDPAVSEGKLRFKNTRDRFYEESEGDMTGFLRAFYDNGRYADTVAGRYEKKKDAYRDRTIERILKIRVSGGEIIFETLEKGDHVEARMSRSFSIDTGNVCGVEVVEENYIDTCSSSNYNSGAGGPDDIEITVDHNVWTDGRAAGEQRAPYLFRMQKTEGVFGGSGMYLQILEQPSQRVIKSVKVARWDSYRDENGRTCEIYPVVIPDYLNKRLIFVAPQDEFRWSLYDMPVPPLVRRRMSYHVSRPLPFRERSAIDRRRNAYKEDFREALKSGDFDRMLSSYDGIWKLPLTSENSLQARMNAGLMSMCRMPGLYQVDRFAINRIWGHDPDDPAPCGVYGILPLMENEPENPFGSQDKLPAGAALRDDKDEIFYYLPWSREEGHRPDCIKLMVWHRNEHSMFERLIPLDLGGRYIEKVIGVSTFGKFMILELRREDEVSFTVVCASLNGRYVREILSDRGEPELKAVFLEDDMFGPNRGYIWQPYTRNIVYFEMDREEIYSDLLRSSDRVGYGFPMPQELFPKYWDYNYSDHNEEVIESVTISVTGREMAVVTVGKKSGEDGSKEIVRSEKNMYVYETEADRWERYDLHHVSKIVLSSNLTYFLLGTEKVIGGQGMSWYLNPVKMKMKQKYLWELREYSAESRVAYISDDLCRVLDGAGRSIYAICWKYAK